MTYNVLSGTLHTTIPIPATWVSASHAAVCLPHLSEVHFVVLLQTLVIIIIDLDINAILSQISVSEST